VIVTNIDVLEIKILIKHFELPIGCQENKNSNILEECWEQLGAKTKKTMMTKYFS